MKRLFFIIPVFFLFAFSNEKPAKLKHSKFVSSPVKEPSDICLSASKQNYFVVSDDGYLYETDLNFRITRKADFEGYDCEAVWADEKYVYVVEESIRNFRLFNVSDLKLVRTIPLDYMGARNSGIESLTYNKTKNCFVALTEKDPLYLYELDENFRVINRIDYGNLPDVSAITYHNDVLYLLSDEGMTISKLNPDDYSIIKTWKINVLNPEGICFSPEGKIVIAADDLERFYFFENPE